MHALFFPFRFMTPLVVLIAALTIAGGVHGAPAKAWVTEGPGGLHYETNGAGDRIPDFSHAGYGGGGVKIPDVPIKKTVKPCGGDDSKVIQTAVDEVAAMPTKDGFCGAVLLAQGTFNCSEPIVFSRDGVVLRGSGTSRLTGSTIAMTGTAHVCIIFKGLTVHKEEPGAKAAVTDSYLPCGGTSVTVADASRFRAGDKVVIKRAFSKQWIHSMGMDNLIRDGRRQVWMKENGLLSCDRSIRLIEGKRLVLDLPFSDAINSKLLAPGDVTVTKVSQDRQLAHCGLEALAILSAPPSGKLTAPNNTAVRMERSEDCWVRNVFMNDTLNNVIATDNSRRVTIEGVDAFHSATVERGAGYPADFTIRGTQILFNRCSSTGDGSFFVATMNCPSMLNAVLNCTFLGKGAIQPHGRWSTALLLDNCRLADGKIEYINRGTCGSGHGWTMGWGVAWNCVAKAFDIQQPPGAMNWCIGCTNTPGGEKPAINDGFSSFGKPVLPKSLYLAQLRDRLGEQALKNIGY